MGSESATCWHVEELDTGGYECSVNWTAYFSKCDNGYTAPDDCDTSGVAAGDWVETSFDGCVDDPYCVYDDTEALVTLSGPGVAGAGVTYDPVSDDLRILGGYTGCRDGGCTAWDDSYIHGQSEATRRLHAVLAADDASIDVTTGALTPVVAGQGSLYATASGWPSWVTFGVSGVASAPLGLVYDHGTRQQARSGTGSVAYVGGSVWRDAAIIQEHLIDWSVDATVAIGTVSTGTFHTWSPADLDFTPGSRRDAAAAAIDPTRVLVVGGQGGEGIDDILLVDTATGAISIIDETTSRYGASVTYDPVAGQGIILGGRDSSSVTIVEVDDDPTRLSDGSSWQMGTSAVTMEQDVDDPDTWVLQQTFTTTHSCEDSDGGSRCGAALATLYLPTIAQVDLETLDVALEYDDGLVVQPRVLEYGLAELDLLYAVKLRLPRVLADGETLAVTVSYQAHAEDVGSIEELRTAADGAPHTRRLKRFTFGDDATPAWQLDALPAWWGTGGDFEASFDQRVTATWTVDPAGDSAVLGTGQLAAGGTLPASLSGGPSVQPIDHTITVLDGVDHAGQVTTATGLTLDIFIDAGLDSTRLAATEDYALDGPLGEDLDDLASQLGSHPLGYDALAFLRQHPDATSAGLAFHGYRLVSRTAPDGTLWVDGDDGTDAGALWETTVHESAHAWLGTEVQFDADQRWLREGLATFIASARYADAWVSRNDTSNAATTITQAIAASGELGLEDETAAVSVIYNASSYIILQAWLLHVANGGSDASFWEALRTALSGLDYGDEVSEATLAELLDDWSGEAGFYERFVTAGALSIPMIALTELTLPTEGGTDTGDTGDTGSAGSPGSYTIQQLQWEMLAAGSWEAAPYVLACSDVDDMTELALEECLLPDAEVYEATGTPLVPSLLYADTESGTPTVAGSSAGGSVLWTMHAGPALVVNQGIMGLLASMKRYRLLRCSADAVDLACLDDADGDGHVDQGDCDDLDSSVHPLWVAPDEAPCWLSTTDHNCDGWTCPL